MMFKLVGGAIAAAATLVVGLIVNEVGGTSKDISEPYSATFMYCAAWNHTKNGATCMFYNTGRETRIDTEIKGLFFDTTGYRVVR